MTFNKHDGTDEDAFVNQVLREEAEMQVLRPFHRLEAIMNKRKTEEMVMKLQKMNKKHASR